jgi:hypothetical protein
MGNFKIDGASRPGILLVELHGSLSAEDMAALGKAHQEAVIALKGAPYRVFCDLRNMLPLSPEAAASFQAVKTAGALQPNFQGSAVLVSSSVVAMQHRRTSIESGVIDTELICDDEAACWEHLRRITRKKSIVA